MSTNSKLLHPDLHVTYTQAEVKQRRLSKINMIGPETTLGVHNGDIRTLSRALLERMFFCKVGNSFLAAPEIKLETIEERMGYFRREMINFSAKPISYEDVVNMYSGRKRTIYNDAYEMFLRRGLRREDAVIAAFVKVEKVNTEKAPRCIQPRSPVYNLCLGSYIKPIEHRIYRRIAKVWNDGPVVMKGFTTQQVANILKTKWDTFSDPVAVGLDATKFDMHVCRSMLEWEHSSYLRAYGNDKFLSKLLKWQRDNKGRGTCEDGKLKYSVSGKRASGDMNTALGNCIIMCAAVHAYCKSKGVDAKLANNGDDCVVFMERKDLKTFSKGLSDWFLEIGFRMTVEEPVYDFEQIEFCQMHPISTINGWNMVRNIKTALQKDTICTMPLVAKSARKWMYSVGECGIAITSGVPIMQSFYQAYVRNGIKCSKINKSPIFNTGLRMMRGTQMSKSSSITNEARFSVFKAWGITPDEQLALEEYFDRWTFSGAVDINQTHNTPLVLNVL